MPQSPLPRGELTAKAEGRTTESVSVSAPLGGWRGPAGYGRLIDLALPMLVSMGAYSFMMFCDRMFLSWSSAEQLAAVVPASAALLTVMCLFFGTTVYTSVFVAQYHGADRDDRIAACIWAGLAVAAVGQVIVGLTALAADPIFALFDHPARVQTLEVEYFTVAAAGAGAQMASSVFAGFFSGRGLTRPVMWISCLGAGLNIPLDYALIFGKWGAPEMGMSGAALATILSQWLTLVVWLWLTFRPENEARYRIWSSRGIPGEMLGRLFRFGFPNGVHFFLDAFAWTAFSLFIGQLGVVELAASNIAWQVNTLALLPILGIGAATGILVGQFQGARKSDHAAQAVRSGLGLVLGYMSCLGLFLVLMPEQIVWPFTLDKASFSGVQALAGDLLRFVAALGFAQGVQMTLAYALKSAGDVTFILRVLAVGSLFGFVLPVWWMVRHDVPLQYLWSWFVLQAAVVASIFWSRFRSGQWRAICMIEVEPLVSENQEAAA